MVRIEGDIVINRPPQEVFDLVADERNEPRFNLRMRRAELITQGPIGVGSRFRAEVASAGRPIEMVIEYTGFERPRRLASTTGMASMVVGYTLTFEPVTGGTRMRWSGDLEPHGPTSGRHQARSSSPRRRQPGTARRPAGGCGGSSLTPGRAGWSR
jgi:uncharacterized protein YndB with AHSA1/START domain